MPSATSRDDNAEQYRDDQNLAARQSIYAFQQPVVDLWNGSLDLAGLAGDESVLDIGCGNGLYLAVLRGRRHHGPIYGADLSAGMLPSARAIAGDAPLLVADAQALPFARDSIDVTLAMHMLYHVPDRPLAIGEMRRVLRPGGVALVVTNAEAHMRELDDLIVECAAAATGIERAPIGAAVLFKMEGGAEELEASFGSVTRHDFESELIVDAIPPVVAYARSMQTFVADTDREFAAVMVELERRLGEIIATDGAFHITSASGCFVCR